MNLPMIRFSPIGETGRRLVVATIVALTGIAFLFPSPARAASPCEATIASELAAQGNAERVARGFPAATVFNATLAQSWAENLRSTGGFSHSPPDYAKGYGFASYWEDLVVIPGNFASGQAVVSFMGSRPHRAAILSQGTDLIGAGVAYDPARNVTIVVLHLASSTMAMAVGPHDTNPPATPVVTTSTQGSTCGSVTPPPTNPPPPNPPPTNPPPPTAPLTPPPMPASAAAGNSPSGGQPGAAPPPTGPGGKPQPGPNGQASPAGTTSTPTTTTAVTDASAGESAAPVGTNPTKGSNETGSAFDDRSGATSEGQPADPPALVAATITDTPASAAWWVILPVLAAVGLGAAATILRSRSGQRRGGHQPSADHT